MVIFNSSGNSEWLETNLGVPQGSVLGPLLFNPYVNDLKDLLDGCTTKHLIGADDLQIYLHTGNSKKVVLDGVAQLAEVARIISEWAACSGLRPNPGQIKAIYFGSARNVNTID